MMGVKWSSTMKNLLATAGMLCFISYASFAQIQIGIHAGVSGSKVIENNTIAGWDSTQKPFYKNRSSVHAGIVANLPIAEGRKIFIQTGVNYQGIGNQFFKQYDTLHIRKAVDTALVEKSFYTNYINIPVNLGIRHQLTKKVGITVSMGPYFSFFLNGSETYSVRTFKRDSVKNTNTDTVNKSSIRYTSKKTLFEVGKGNAAMSVVDVGGNIRLSIDFPKFFFSGFYSQSFKSFYQPHYNGTFKHQVLGASLGVWLDTSNKQKEVVKKLPF
jgi:OmpA-OmpF porin, OOP family